MEPKKFSALMNEKGWVIFDEVVDPLLVKRMQHDIELAYHRCRAIQVENGIPENNAYTVHHLIGHEDSFLEYLRDCPVSEYIAQYFDGPYILNSFGGAMPLPSISRTLVPDRSTKSSFSWSGASHIITTLSNFLE